MPGEIGTKTCIDLKSKVLPLLIDFDKTCTAFGMGRKCGMFSFSLPAAMRGDTGMKNSFRLKSKLPFITDRFRRN
jgi:hypothetical protein